ncbi:hypothetical protein Y032_0310g2116 [Ancylostoma ceylanicum]|uniref:NTR domain-containing protein n=1 Tax=Ancylostoma ceylanicum TaxID=53326 RepID=A0A016S2B8_9BILA|nr:hypothetical protein Y032_0310g2116 [Ancylostoma ceylanicum]
MCLIKLSPVLTAIVKTINFDYGANDTKATDSGKWSYNIWHTATWKGDIRSTSLLTTPNSEDACGVPGLSKDVEYFITGKNEKDGEIFFTYCDFVMPSDHLDQREREYLLQLMWYPDKCKEKDPEISGPGTDEKPTGGDGEKTVEGTDEKGKEENGDEPPQENDEKTVDDNAEQPVDGNDEKGVEENGDELPKENEEPPRETDDEPEEDSDDQAEA